MPATRSQIRRAKPITHSVDFGDGVTVEFTFDANKITDAWFEDWTRHEEESNTPALNAMLADLVESWDLLESDDGPVIPVTSEEIGKLFSLPDKIRLMKEFSGLPSDAEGNASRNISSTPGSGSTNAPGSRLNGQPPSPTPEPAASPSLTHLT